MGEGQLGQAAEMAIHLERRRSEQQHTVETSQTLFCHGRGQPAH